MKRLASFSFILVVMVLTALTASPSFAAATFCWKDSYGRGAGEVPRTCAPGKEKLGLFCYDPCDPGMKRAGIDCHSICPSKMDDQGLFCRASETPRGSGYPWQGGDALNLSKALSRCETDKGSGNCEKWGAVIYPKCQDGYSNFGCCICRPAVPNCERLGLSKAGQVDLSCAKKIKFASPPELGTCGPGQEMDAGLCYQKCRSGYYGVGPVCWKRSPWSWVDCGMGAAVDTKTCGTVVLDQVYQVGQVAMTIATLGASAVATKATTSATDPRKFAGLKQQYDNLIAGYNAAKQTYPKLKDAEKAAYLGNTALQINTAGNTALNIFTEADIARLAAQIAQIVDPSGVAGTIASYTYDKCSKYFSEEAFPEQHAQWVRLRTERFPTKLVISSFSYPDNLTMLGTNMPDDQKGQEGIRGESWRVEPQGDDGTVLLKAAIRGPGMCLGIIPDKAAGQNQPQVQPCSGDPSGQPWKGQHWKLDQDGNWILLKTLYSGGDKCLGIFSQMVPGGPVSYWPVLQKCGADPKYPNTVPGQHWKIAPSPYKGAGAGGWTP